MASRQSGLVRSTLQNTLQIDQGFTRVCIMRNEMRLAGMQKAYARIDREKEREGAYCYTPNKDIIVTRRNLAY